MKEKNKKIINWKCSKCGISFIPFRKNFKCPNCNESYDEPRNIFLDFIPKLVNLMEYHKKKYGKYRPDEWQIGSFLENAQRYTSELFDLIEANKFSDPEDFIKYYFNRAKKDGKEKYLCKHFEGIALATAAEIQERGEKERIRIEKEQIRKLKNAKTGESITLDRSYGVIGPNSEDNGWRFIRKKDAEECLRLKKEHTKPKPKWWTRIFFSQKQ